MHGWEWNYLKRWFFSEPFQLLEGNADVVSDVALSRDGETLATCGYDKTIRLWTRRASDARWVSAAVLVAHEDYVHSVAFGPGSLLASSSRDGSVKIWNWSQGSSLAAEPIFTLRHREAVPWYMAFAPRTALLAVGYENGDVVLWDAQTGARVRVLHGHAKRVMSVAFRPDGRELATAGYDGAIQLWDVAAGTRRRGLSNDLTPATGLAYSPDGRRIASTGFDMAVRFGTQIQAKKFAHFMAIMGPRLMFLLRQMAAGWRRPAVTELSKSGTASRARSF